MKAEKTEGAKVQVIGGTGRSYNRGPLGSGTGKQRRFKSADDVRRYLAGLLNRCEAGEVTPEVASKLAYVCNYVLKAIAEHDARERLEELESQVQALMGGIDE